MDKYSLNARIYPVVILLLPLVIIGITYSLEYESYIQALGTIGVTSALVYLFSNLGRDSGKRKEPVLWRKWGGMPTAQVLSFNTSFIDEITKQKYHDRLLELSPIDTSIDFKNSKLEDVNEIYRSWTKFLITQTRDTKKYSLLFKENISYGFRRNLWGLKPISLILLSIIILGNFLIQGFTNGFQSILVFPIQFYISEVLLIILLLIWIYIINSNWIKIPAFSYAERLLESIDTIE